MFSKYSFLYYIYNLFQFDQYYIMIFIYLYIYLYKLGLLIVNFYYFMAFELIKIYLFKIKKKYWLFNIIHVLIIFAFNFNKKNCVNNIKGGSLVYI